MSGYQQRSSAFPDAQTLRAWEDMRADLLHELQEGASAPDDLIDLMGQLVVTLKTGVSDQERLRSQRKAA
jgi:hypothetical protein